MQDFNQNENLQQENLDNQTEINVEQPPEITEDQPQHEEVTVTHQPQPQFTVYNPINYTPVQPITEHKPISKGFKIFCIILAAVIALSSTCFVGYFIGKNSIGSVFSGKKVELNLAEKPSDEKQLSASGVYEKVNPSIVGIVVYNDKNATQASGVIYSEDGYIVTNDHIYEEIAAPKFKIYTYNGEEYDAKYVAGDKISDLAVLKIENGKFEKAVFGNSDQLTCGESVVAIGRPNDAKSSSTITKGIISATERRVSITTNYSSRLIQTDSAINPGSSGGALVNMYGQVIGITSSKLVSSTQDLIGYAIPTTVMERFVPELIEKGSVVSRAKLGITYTFIDSVTAEVNGYKSTGIYVASVEQDSDLYKKVNEGDIISHINGIKVTSDSIVLDVIDQSRAGDKISVTVVTNNGATKTLDAVLKANVGESSYSEIEKPNENDSNQNGGAFTFPFGE